MTSPAPTPPAARVDSWARRAAGRLLRVSLVVGALSAAALLIPVVGLLALGPLVLAVLGVVVSVCLWMLTPDETGAGGPWAGGGL